MKKILFLSLFLLTQISWGQLYKISDISGAYRVGGGLYITESHKAYIVAMGTLLMGNVKIGENKVHIAFSNPEQPYSIFGRFRNEKIKGGFVMMFSFDKHTNINYQSENDNLTSMDRVFNVDTNCWKYPYVFDEKTINPTKIYLANEKNPQEILEFDNMEGFNDFIIFHHEKPKISHLTFEISKDKKSLKHTENDLLTKQKLDEEEQEFISNFDKYFKRTDISNEFYYANPAYNNFLEGILDNEQGFSLNDYTKKQNGKEYYFLNGEDVKSDDYHATNIIYEYKKLPTKRGENKTYKISEKSLLEYRCDY